MKNERSFGIIPLRIQEGEWQILLVQHHAGHWAFPKGHADPGESPQQAAERELFEETGLKIERYLLAEPINENYYFSFRHHLIRKTVQYFMALVQAGNVELQENEIQASEWLSLPQAHVRMTFKEGKRMCLQISEYLKNLDYGMP